MDDSEATYANWGDLPRAVLLQVLSLPLDITKVMGQLNAKLGSRHLDVGVIGPSSHTPYIASALKAAESTVSFQYYKSLEPTKLSGLSRIVIVEMVERGSDSDNLRNSETSSCLNSIFVKRFPKVAST